MDLRMVASLLAVERCEAAAPQRSEYIRLAVTLRGLWCNLNKVGIRRCCCNNGY
jgi:hypothetical protein